MINWRIYYADGTTYSNEDGLWINAPGNGVLIIIVRDEVLGRRWLQKHEYYVFRQTDDDPWPTHDARDVLSAWGEVIPEPFPPQNNLHDYLLSVNLRKFFKFGRATPDPNWNTVGVAAAADSDFPVGTSPQRRHDDPGFIP